MKLLYEIQLIEDFYSPKEGKLYRWNKELYYIIKELSFNEYIAIPTKVNNEIVDFENYVFLIVTDKYHEIRQKANLDESVKATGWCKDTSLWYLLTQADLSSVRGRSVILENFLDGYDSSINNLPKWMTIPTSKLDLNFRRKTNFRAEFVYIEKIVGTAHPTYEGRSWYDIFLLLKRTNNFINALYKQQYYDELENSNEAPNNMEFIKIDDQYFINSGNHRSTLAKIMGRKKIYSYVISYKTDYDFMNAYKELLGYGFLVKIEECKYYSYNDEVDIKEDWEIFIVSFNNKEIKLFGLKMIRKFINIYEMIDINKNFTIFRRFIEIFSNRKGYEDYFNNIINDCKNDLINFKKQKNMK